MFTKAFNDMEFKSKNMSTGLERPDISPTMGAEKYSLLWWGPFPGLFDGDPSQVWSFKTWVEKSSGDDIWGECWWLVGFPPTGKVVEDIVYIAYI